MKQAALIKALNAGWLIFERAVGALIAFFVMTLMARHLGPEGFGAYAYLFGVVALLMPLAQFGLEGLVMREVLARPEDEGRILGSAMALHVLLGLAGYGLAIAAIVLFGGPSGVVPALMAGAGIQLLATPVEPPNAAFKARERMGVVVLPRIGVSLLVAGVALLLVLREADLGAFVWLRGAEAALFLAAGLVAYAVAGPGRAGLRVSLAEIGRLLRGGLPLALAAGAVIVYMRIDQVMLGQMSSETELGRYSVAVRVADLALIVPVALRAAFFASLSRARERGPEAFDRQGQRVYDAMLVAALGTMVGLGLASFLLFEPIFGAAFAEGRTMVLILLLGLPWVALGSALSAVLTIRGTLWMVTVMTGIAAIANIGLNLLVIPTFGAIGAAWTTVFSYWLATFGLTLLAPSLRAETWKMTRALNAPAAALRLLAGLREKTGAP